jgi:hypothetical protein
MLHLHLTPDFDLSSEVSVDFVVSPDAQISSMTCSGVLGRPVLKSLLSPLARPFFPSGVDASSLASVSPDEVQARAISPVRHENGFDRLIYVQLTVCLGYPALLHGSKSYTVRSF